MKKIVPKLLVISSQIFVGALFFIIAFSDSNEVNYKVNSKEIDKLSKFVYNEEKLEVINEEIQIEELKEEDKKEIIIEEQKEIVIPEEEVVEDKFFMDKEVLNTYTGILTGYGPDCVGCGNFKTNKVSTASGYHIANIVDGAVQPAFTVTYEDSEYGEVRIVAGDSTLPFKSIVRITIPNQDPIIAVVLDRGSTVGFENCRSPKGCLTNFDLLYPTEAESLGKTRDVKFEILRIGA